MAAMLSLVPPKGPFASPATPAEVTRRAASGSDRSRANVSDRSRSLAPTGAMEVQVLESPDQMEAHASAWEELARSALEPNVFAEPWFFRPAWQAFHADLPLRLALVYRQDNKAGMRRLCGVFPLERQARYRGWPVASWRLWTHQQCFLATPLLHRDCAKEALGALLAWARTQAAFVEFPFVHGDGPFHHAVVDLVNEQRLVTFVQETFTRALLTTAASAETFLAQAMSTGNRKELRRQRKRLSEQGQLATRVLDPTEDVEPWLAQFLALEAAGWKGQEQTALGARQEERFFFQTVARAAHARGRLFMLGLFLDKKPIALKCNFLMEPGAIAFKIAYDEAFARFSPGVQLELDNIQACHDRPGLRWLDSCAIAQHFMINRLWRDRRTMQTVLISTGRPLGHLTVGALPLVRAFKRFIRQK